MQIDKQDSELPIMDTFYFTQACPAKKAWHVSIIDDKKVTLSCDLNALSGDISSSVLSDDDVPSSDVSTLSSADQPRP